MIDQPEVYFVVCGEKIVGNHYLNKELAVFHCQQRNAQAMLDRRVGQPLPTAKHHLAVYTCARVEDADKS